MINNELKWKKRLLFLAHAYFSHSFGWIRTEHWRSVPESSIVVYRLINNGICFHCLYWDKRGEC